MVCVDVFPSPSQIPVPCVQGRILPPFGTGCIPCSILSLPGKPFVLSLTTDPTLPQSHILCQIFPMRRILTSVVLLVLLLPSLALGETMDDLIVRNSDRLHYKKFTDVPFTGPVKGQHQWNIRNGKKVGPWVGYLKDGTVDKRITGTFKNNLKIPD